MVSSVATKVQRLETAYGGGGLPPCDRCGWGGDEGEPFDDFGPDDTFELVWEPEEDPEASEAEDEYCPDCGRHVNIVVRWPEDLPS